MRTAFVIIAALAIVSSAWAGNLLVNPGFETGGFDGWTVGGTAPNGVATYGAAVPAHYPGYVNVRSGEYAAFGVVKGACCDTPQPITLTQTVAVEANQNYDIGFYLSNWSASSVGASAEDAPYGIEIYANGAPLLSSGYILLYADQSWYNFSGTYNTGAATLLTVQYQIVASGTGDVPMSLDDFYVNGTGGVPEPSTVALFGAGLALLAFRRFRR